MAGMREQLQGALSDAFSLQTLQRTVRFKLDKDLYDYASPQDDKQNANFG